jgi:hypothetical protein
MRYRLVWWNGGGIEVEDPGRLMLGCESCRRGDERVERGDIGVRSWIHVVYLLY